MKTIINNPTLSFLAQLTALYALERFKRESNSSLKRVFYTDMCNEFDFRVRKTKSAYIVDVV